MQYEKDFPFICIDSTYKILKIGYPLSIIITVDRHYHGHPVAFALVKDETENTYTTFLKAFKDCLFDLFKFNNQPKYAMADG